MALNSPEHRVDEYVVRAAFVGAIMVAVASYAFSSLATYTPICARGAGKVQCVRGGMSQTGYEVQQIGAWVLVIGGALLIVGGLIAWWRKPLGSA